MNGAKRVITQSGVLSMPDEPTKSVPELLKDRESLLRLKEAMEKRLANIHSKEEQREVEALSERALNPQCTFDRQHTEMLYTLALFPEHVSLYWKLRERLHRFVHHH